jgi:hypothetical protein
MIVLLVAICASRPRRPVIRQQPVLAYCTACSAIASHIESAVLHASSEDAIRSIASQVCTLADPSLSAPCGHISSLLLDTLAHLLREGFSSEAACAAAQLCPDNRLSSRPAPRIRQPVQSGKGCDICLQIVGYAQALYHQNLTSDEIKAHFDAFCQTFEFPDSALCTAIIDLDFDEIYKEIAQGLDPFSVCMNLAFCEDGPNKSPCESCKQVTSLAEGFVRLGFRGEDIIDKVVEASMALPAEFRSASIEFVYRRLTKSIGDVELLRTVSEICEPGETCGEGRLTSRNVQVPKKGVFCALCTDLADAAAQALTGQKDETDRLFEDFCDQMPGVIGIVCRSVVRQSMPAILEGIAEDIGALENCVRIGLCDQ